jgi:hypothetical protein
MSDAEFCCAPSAVNDARYEYYREELGTSAPMAGEIAGFWSYVHSDDSSDGGRILSLERRLRDEYRIQTGEEITIFVDRESISWGTEWSQRINDAIVGTTFFIPIISPSYFRSQECRRELMKFAREAKRLGLAQLLMPVYWVTVPELDRDGKSAVDEAISLIASYQYEDLRDARLEDESSSAFRKAVSKLASQLALRASEVTELDTAITPLAGDSVVSAAKDDDDDGTPDLLELAVVGEETFPELNKTLEELASEITVIGDFVTDATQQMSTANAQTVSMRTRLNITESLADRLNKPAERIELLGQRYAELLGTLDPAIHAMLDASSARVETSEEEAIRDQFLRTIQGVTAVADVALGKTEEMVEAMRVAAKSSRALRVPLKRIQTGLRGMLDARALIDEWGRRAAELQTRP